VENQVDKARIAEIEGERTEEREDTERTKEKV